MEITGRSIFIIVRILEQNWRFTNLWKKINLNIHFGNDKSNFSKSRPYLSRSKQVFEIAVSAKLDSKLSEGYRW